MIPVEDALATVHQKEATLRATMLQFELALARMRQVMQVPPSQEAWLSSFATRLNFLNKQHRIALKNDLSALSTRLRLIYGQKNVASSAIAQLEKRAQDASETFAEAKTLMSECQVLYDRRVLEKTIDVANRVQLRRTLSHLRVRLEEAEKYAAKIKADMDEWRVYFKLLSSEKELSKFLDKLRLHKLTKTAAEEKVAPVFGRILEVCKERDTIISESSALGLAQETLWLAFGSRGIREREFRREIALHDALLERARAQMAVQAEVLGQAENLTALACSPTSLPGPDGMEISFDRLREAYTRFQALEATCDTMEESAKPLMNTLRTLLINLQDDREPTA
ncbi:hypothetical protein OH77DRAFT_1461238 [Trametes cingulata]|nr:hypothetical protein OH77DRAFT_1461238 [Trametes cingulata]